MNWVLVGKNLNRCIISTIVLLVSVSFGFSQTSQKTDTFQFEEFWISRNADWQIAYDDVKYCSSALIIKSKDSVYGVLFPGSLALSNDTISVNQEAGFPNTCVKVGKVKVGEGAIVRIDYPHENIEFMVFDDTISINQEAGFPNTCLKVEKVKEEEGEIVKIDYPHKYVEFKILNDTIIEFDKQQFIRTEKTVLYGCWCDWE
ncbi:hypothetical protein [Flammeovirga sp. SJP92]|uniref:hypothetical protein n=1 Tax=Flammeovirga sp. SJP92 TaxID=1775430 RepID=UPI0007893657|nr:hypothetical protein [Flammeovirga sp. SJP92]KXX71147.1 hypothetical protein AVL50_09960 [Flammeovirga sp. SJP92]